MNEKNSSENLQLFQKMIWSFGSNLKPKISGIIKVNFLSNKMEGNFLKCVNNKKLWGEKWEKWRKNNLTITAKPKRKNLGEGSKWIPICVRVRERETNIFSLCKGKNVTVMHTVTDKTSNDCLTIVWCLLS